MIQFCVNITVTHYVKCVNTNSKLILHYYWPFISDLTSQQQTAALLILLPEYSHNDVIHILLKVK